MTVRDWQRKLYYLSIRLDLYHVEEKDMIILAWRHSPLSCWAFSGSSAPPGHSSNSPGESPKRSVQPASSPTLVGCWRSSLPPQQDQQRARLPRGPLIHPRRCAAAEQVMWADKFQYSASHFNAYEFNSLFSFLLCFLPVGSTAQLLLLLSSELVSRHHTQVDCFCWRNC